MTKICAGHHAEMQQAFKTIGRKGESTVRLASLRSKTAIPAWDKVEKIVSCWSLERSVGGSFQGVLLFGLDFNELNIFEQRHLVVH